MNDYNLSSLQMISKCYEDGFNKDIESIPFTYIYDFMSRKLSWERIRKLSLEVYGFDLPQNKTASIFVYNIVTGSFERLVSDNIIYNDEARFVATICDSHVQFKGLDPDTMIEWLTENSSKNILSVPVYFQHNFKEKLHHVQLVFHLKNKKVVICDPNGKMDMFPNDGGIDYNFVVEETIKKYIELFSDVLDITFVSQSVWNSSGKGVNVDYSDIGIGSGHCVCLSLLAVHISSIYEMDITDVYKLLIDLDREIIAHIIVQYSRFIRAQFAEHIKISLV